MFLLNGNKSSDDIGVYGIGSSFVGDSTLFIGTSALMLSSSSM